MTNAPSKTTTSTAPAPVLDSITSGDSNTLPLLTPGHSSISPVPDISPPAMVRKVGGTTFEVFFHFSTENLETSSDKISRLIHRELDSD